MTCDGVPLIIPVDVSSDNPVGRDGETEYEVGVPVMVGVSSVMGEFLVKMFGE